MTEAYRAAGVDRDAASIVKKRIAGYARLTHGPQVLGGVGFFAGMYALEGYKEPVLVATTDTTGTKAHVAAALRRWEGLGVDLVNLNLGDLITCGARPLLFLDSISIPKLDLQMVEELVRGVVRACRDAGCALLGGETAEMPDTYQPGAFDLAGFLVGVVERDSRLDPTKVRAGDALLGVPSSGVHTNGFSLVRKALSLDHDPAKELARFYPELGATLGDVLLAPHRAYWPLLEPVMPHIRAMAHVTGGGVMGNIPRSLPDGLAAVLRKNAWETPPVFHLIQRKGSVSTDEMYRVFNMGVGMVLICAPEKVAEVQRLLPEARTIGEVVPHAGGERVSIV